MWLKYSITIILFYLFAVLQNSLFAHFSLFGATPSLVFILFYLLIFFFAQGARLPDRQGPASGWDLIFLSAMAGFFLDLFSLSYFGTSAVIILIIGFFTKKTQKLLRGGQKDNYPLIYFLPLFFISLLAYHLLLNGFNFFLGLSQITINLSWNFVAEAIYNLVFASIIFGIYKKFIFSRIDNRQLSLFK